MCGASQAAICREDDCNADGRALCHGTAQPCPGGYKSHTRSPCDCPVCADAEGQWGSLLTPQVYFLQLHLFCQLSRAQRKVLRSLQGDEPGARLAVCCLPNATLWCRAALLAHCCSNLMSGRQGFARGNTGWPCCFYSLAHLLTSIAKDACVHPSHTLAAPGKLMHTSVEAFS